MQETTSIRDSLQCISRRSMILITPSHIGKQCLQRVFLPKPFRRGLSSPSAGIPPINFHLQTLNKQLSRYNARKITKKYLNWK